MATKIAFQLIPLETHLGRPSFDLSQLPFVVMPNVEVADVSTMLPPSMFENLEAEVGRHQMRFFSGRTKHAFVHRYEEHPEAPTFQESAKIAKKNDELLNEVFACSRIVGRTEACSLLFRPASIQWSAIPEWTSTPENRLTYAEKATLISERGLYLRRQLPTLPQVQKLPSGCGLLNLPCHPTP